MSERLRVVVVNGSPSEPSKTMALVDVIRSDETERLSQCAADDCDNVLIDLSRNRSRRYCDAGCTNRMAAQAYRARRTKV